MRSRESVRTGASREVLPDRFWDKTIVDENGCWLWIGSLTQDGYGQFRLNGAIRLAHRVAYQHLVGEIPAHLECDHLCRTRFCVNPEHLELVTRSENVKRGLAAKTATPEAGGTVE